MPSDKSALIFDELCNAPMIGSNTYINTTVFYNYKQNYTGYQCSNMAVFSQPSEFKDEEQFGGTYLQTTRCINCDDVQLFRFKEMNPAHAGWIGGCGNFSCTGRVNTLVTDLDGTFLSTLPGAQAFGNCTIGTQINQCLYI